jgi:hypothetical protein
MLTHAGERPWPGGEANGVGNERPDTPFVKCGVYEESATEKVGDIVIPLRDTTSWFPP